MIPLENPFPPLQFLSRDYFLLCLRRKRTVRGAKAGVRKLNRHPNSSLPPEVFPKLTASPSGNEGGSFKEPRGLFAFSD